MSPWETRQKERTPTRKARAICWFALFYIDCVLTFSWTAEALAQQVTQENLDKGLIYPPFSNIRKISAHIAANVAAKAYELGELLLHQLFVATCLDFAQQVNSGRVCCCHLLGLASRLPCPKDLVKYAESCMYNPVYRSYRWMGLQFWMNTSSSNCRSQ